MATNMFDGLQGRVVAPLMARMNRAAEEAAVRLLGPGPGESVLAVGIGPGVGIQLLAEAMGTGRIAGMDPSKVMIDRARRRNKRWIEEGLVELVQTAADDLPWPDGSFGGVLAVNSIQLWEPIEQSVAEVARVLRSGGRLVTLTHDWAIQKSTGRAVDDWLEWLGAICERHALMNGQLWRAHAERGTSVVFTATRQSVTSQAP